MRPISVLLAILMLLPCAASAAQRLRIEKVVIDTRGGPRSFRMEIAADNAARATGLMHRTHLARDAGMLFDFRQNVMTAFWMKDTPLPLDMIFVRSDGTISTVAANAVPFSTAEVVSAEPIRVVIEINGGVARALGISPGDRVHASAFPKPSAH